MKLKKNINKNTTGNIFIIIPLLVCVVIAIMVPITFYCFFTNDNNEQKWCSTIPNLFTLDGLYNKQNRFEAGSIVIFIFIWVITIITWIFVVEFVINVIIFRKHTKYTLLGRSINYFKLDSFNKNYKKKITNNIKFE